MNSHLQNVCKRIRIVKENSFPLTAWKLTLKMVIFHYLNATSSLCLVGKLIYLFKILGTLSLRKPPYRSTTISSSYCSLYNKPKLIAGRMVFGLRRKREKLLWRDFNLKESHLFQRKLSSWKIFVMNGINLIGNSSRQ